MANPLLAAALSIIIPGLGQFYAGHLMRGIGVFFLTVIVGILTAMTGSLVIAIIAALDAYFLAMKT